MKTRVKIKASTEISREEAEQAMHEVATYTNALRRLVSDRDAAILEVTNRVAVEIADCEVQIKNRTTMLRDWAEKNKGEFDGRKSLEMSSGTLGFRTGTPKLALISRAFTWEAVLDNLKRMANRFVRTKEEVDKESILREHASFTDTQAAADLLRLWGVKVVKEESFYVEPKLAELPVRIIEKADQ